MFRRNRCTNVSRYKYYSNIITVNKLGDFMKAHRVLILSKILSQSTGPDNPLTINQILKILEDDYTIKIDRNTLKRDIATLKSEDPRVIEIKTKSNTSRYYMNPLFTREEVRILADAIGSSRFIADCTKQTMLKKMLHLLQDNDHSLLKSTIDVEYCVPREIDMASNLKICHECIQASQRLQFQKAKYTLQKTIEVEEKHYDVIPQKICYSNERYYLIADYDSGDTRHFRLDRLVHLQPGEPHKKSRYIDTKSYRCEHMDMFGNGTFTTIRIQMDKSLLDSVIENFGTRVCISHTVVNPDTFIFSCKTHINRGLTRWVLKQGHCAKVLEPKELIDNVKNELEITISKY